MTDIREIERQTQEILRRMMGSAMGTLSEESIANEEKEEVHKEPQTPPRAKDNLNIKSGRIEKPLPDSGISTATSKKR